MSEFVWYEAEWDRWRPPVIICDSEEDAAPLAAMLRHAAISAGFFAADCLPASANTCGIYATGERVNIRRMDCLAAAGIETVVEAFVQLGGTFGLGFPE